MSYILLTRNPRNSKLVVITDGEDNVPIEFDTHEEAVDATRDVPVCQAWGFMIAEVS
jgi:Mg-chelatase subunit ChlD